MTGEKDKGAGKETVIELIKRLGERKIKIWLEGEALKFKAPKGALDAELKAELVRSKAQLISFLREQDEGASQAPPLIPREKIFSLDKGPLAISYAQQRLWFIEYFAGESGQGDYNIPVALKLKGSLDIGRLEKALNKLIERHEVLQCYFLVEKGMAVQLKHPSPVLSLNLDDISELENTEQVFYLDQAVEENISTPFRLSEWPLFKVRLIKSSIDGELSHSLLATMHHIVSDGWSMGIFIRELSYFYNHTLDASPLASLDFQYADYARWQKSWLDENTMSQQLGYWKTRLQDLPVLELALDKQRPRSLTSNGAHHHFTIDAEIVSSIQNLAKDQGLTLFMILMAVFQVLLHKLSRQEDFAVGVPIANRVRPEWEQLIGFFVNTLCIRADINSSMMFSELIEGVQASMLEAYDHQDIPFDRVIEQSVRERDLSRSPLFQVMFSLQNSPNSQTIHLDGLEIEKIAKDMKSARYEMTWNMVEADGLLSCDIEYNSDLFELSSIEGFANYFIYLLAEVSEKFDQSISMFDLEAPKQTIKRVSQLNLSETDYPKEKFIPELFLESVKQFPNKVALRDDVSEMTYALLDRQSGKVAAELKEKGVEAGDKIVIAMDRSFELIIGILGILKLGATYVPIDPKFPEERIKYIWKDTNSRKILLRVSDVDRFTALLDIAGGNVRSELSQLVINLDQVLSNRTPCEFDATWCKGLKTNQHEAAVLYTSGSTGEPKGVRVPHRAMVRLVKNTNFAQFGSEEIFAHISNICFDAASMEIWGALLNGGELAIISQDTLLNVHAFAKAINDFKISQTFVTGGLFKLMAKEIPSAFSNVKTVVTGGEVFDLEAGRAVLNSGHAPRYLVNGYGPTENATFTTCYLIEKIDDSQASMPIGFPVSNTSVMILDAQGKLLPPGVPGELVAGGDGVGLGYLNKQSLSDEKFLSGDFLEKNQYVYRTGDLARFRENGAVELIGRIDDQVKIRGYRIEPTEIENIINADPSVQNCALIIAKDKKSEKRLIAYVKFNENSDPTFNSKSNDSDEGEQNAKKIEGLKRHLEELLPDYMQPSLIVEVPEILLNANGKVDRRAFPEPDWDQVGSRDYKAGRDDLENGLIDIWQALLMVPKIGINDNFFELGGHSLLAAQVVSKVFESLSITINVRLIFEHPTVEGFAQQIRDHLLFQVSNLAPPLIAVDRANQTQGSMSVQMPMSFAQQRLWFIHNMDPNSSAYNMPMTILIQGEVNVSALESSIRKLIFRHESLRTVFLEKDEALVQLIKSCETFSNWTLEFRDGLEDAAIQKKIEANESSVFDLEQGPLFVAELFRNVKGEHLLLMNMHHIISDGWSMEILKRDLLTHYQNEIDLDMVAKDSQKASSKVEVEALPVQYADYAIWQKSWLKGEVLSKLIQYWKNQLEGVPEVLRLPTDKPRPKVQTFNGASISFDIEEVFQRKLYDFCSQNEMTSFMLCIAAYQVLLSRYSGQDDICVGIPIAGRNHPSLENLIGFFVNGLVIRGDLRGRMSVGEYLEQIKEVTIGAFAHQELSADVLIDALGIKRSLSHQPLAQVGFSHLSVDVANPVDEIEGAQFEVLPPTHTTAKYDLILGVVDSGGELKFTCEFNTDLFDISSVEQMMEHYQIVLRLMIENPAQMVDEISWLDAQALLASVNEEAEVYVDIYPLSKNQHAIYLDSIINPETIQNSVGNAIEIHQEINPQYWQKALEFLQSKRAVLRTDIVDVDVRGSAGLYQAVRHSAKTNFEYEDFSDRSLDFDGFVALVKDDVYQAYKVLENELISYRLYKLSDKHFVALLKTHHLFFDGLSGKSFIEDMLAVYQSIEQDELDKLTLRADYFREFVIENNRLLDLKENVAFWSETLGGLAGLSAGPLGIKKTPSPHGVSEVGDASEGDDGFEAGGNKGLSKYSSRVQKNFVFDEIRSQKLKSYCRANGITPSIFFKTIYSFLVQHYCRPQQDFCILEYSHGRSKKYLSSYGVCYQQTPYVVPRDIFKPLSSLEEAFGYAKSYQKEIKHKREFSVQSQANMLPADGIGFMFNYTQFEAALRFQEKAERTVFFSPNVENHVQLFVRERIEGFELILLFGANYFNELEFLERLGAICDQVVESGVKQFGELEICSQDELALTREYNALDKDGVRISEDLGKSADVLSGFRQHVVKSPSSTALFFGDKHLSYLQLDEKSNRLAAYLMERFGLLRGDRVGLFLKRGFPQVVSIYALIKLGVSYIPIESNYPESRVHHILENSQAKLLITNEHLSEVFDSSLVWAEVEVAMESEQPSRQSDITFELDDTFYTIYTSGSTGNAKGADVSRRGVVNLLDWYEKALGFNEADKTLVISAFSFDLTQKNLFSPLSTGGGVVLHDAHIFDPAEIMNIVVDHQISILNCAPSAFYALLDYQSEQGTWAPLSSLRIVMLGGEAILPSRLMAWMKSGECHTRILNSYGPTECSDVVSFYELRKSDFLGKTETLSFDEEMSFTRPVPLGSPIPNAELYVVDENQNLLPPGLVGEIAISGDCVGKGYIGNESLNEASFVALTFSGISKSKKCYLSGDLGYYLLTDDGRLELYYVGRKDFQVKLRGQRIELGEIESRLRDHHLVSDALVLVHEESLVAYVVPDHQGLSAQNELEIDRFNLDILEHAAKALPVYMVPNYLMCLDEWPLSVNGKIDRKQLPAIENKRTKDFVAPRNEMEEKLAAIWCDVLSIDEVSINDGFFELGGHSLLVTKAVSRLKEAFEVDFPLKALFDMQTIAEISEYIKTLEWAHDAKRLQHDSKNEEGREEGLL